jgi:hypothetical protein
MLEALVLVAGLGFLIGLRYRVPAVVVASAAAVVLGPVIAHFTGASFWVVVITPLAALIVLQCGYLGGVLLTYGVSRAKPRGDEDAPDEGCLAAKD